MCLDILMHGTRHFFGRLKDAFRIIKLPSVIQTLNSYNSFFLQPNMENYKQSHSFTVPARSKINSTNFADLIQILPLSWAQLISQYFSHDNIIKLVEARYANNENITLQISGVTSLSNQFWITDQWAFSVWGYPFEKSIVPRSGVGCEVVSPKEHKFDNGHTHRPGENPTWRREKRVERRVVVKLGQPPVL